MGHLLLLPGRPASDRPQALPVDGLDHQRRPLLLLAILIGPLLLAIALDAGILIALITDLAALAVVCLICGYLVTHGIRGPGIRPFVTL